MQKGPDSIHQIRNTSLDHLRGPMEKVSQAAAEIEKMASPSAGPGSNGKTPARVQLETHPLSEFFVNQTPEFLAESLATVILLCFLLANDGLFLTKLIKGHPEAPG